MYRKKNRTVIKLFLRGIVVLFIFFGFFFFSSSFAAGGMKAGDAIQQALTIFTKGPTLEKLQKKTIIPSLYSQSLQVVQKSEVSTLFTTLEKTAERINAYDTNEEPTINSVGCNLVSDDIMYVMYNEDADFKKTINQIVAKNIKSPIQEPTREQYIESCKKFTSCFFDKKDYDDTSITSRAFCKDFIFQNYHVQHSEITDISSLTDVSYGDEFFWNNNLEDSTYDIMADIYKLATLLFVSAAAPVETMFYAFPEITNQTPVEDSIIGSDGRIDRFLPPADISCTGGVCTGTTPVPPVGGTGGGIAGTAPLETVTAPDEQTLSFLEQTNSVIPNDVSVLKGNQCLGSGIVLEEEEERVTTGAEETYLESVLDSISTLQCNQDNQCDTVEDCSCTDCIDAPKCSNVACPASDGICSNEACTCEDCVNEPSLSCVAGSYTGLAAFVDNVQDSGDPSLQDEVKGCFQKCDDIKTNFTAMGTDIAICYARCACDTFESPVFDPTKFDGLTSTFKIEFCMIPPQEASFTRSKKVKNLEEIMAHMRNALLDLKEGGKMWLHTKTKEMLDSSVIKNNFASQFSFTINTQYKSLYPDKSALTQSQEQKETNKLLQNTILRFGSDITLEQEKNKYIVLGDPCADQKEGEAFPTIAAKQAAIDECRDLNIKKQPTLSQPPVATFQDQRITLLSEDVDDFLLKNLDFWMNVKSMLNEMNQIAQALSLK